MVHGKRGKKEELKQTYHQKKDEANQRIMRSYSNEISNITEGKRTEGMNFWKFIKYIKVSRHEKQAIKNKSGKLTDNAEEIVYINIFFFKNLYKKPQSSKEEKETITRGFNLVEKVHCVIWDY